MSNYPRMLYRKGGEDEIFGLKCETSIVEGADEEKAAYLEGWARTPFEAHGVEAPIADSTEDAPPLDDEKLGLLDEIEALQREVSELREQLAAVEGERESATKELGETKALLDEVTTPKVDKKTLTVGAKA